MDLYESSDKNQMTATFELPGISKDKVQIDVQNGNLAVSGETTQTSEQHEQGYAIKERRFGRFVRTIRLPEGTKASNDFPLGGELFLKDFSVRLQPRDVKASMENGVLTVTYPKSSPGQESQRIAIN